MTWLEWLIQPVVAFIGIVILVAINVVVWVFAWGRARGTTNTRIEVIEGRLDNPVVLPECNEIFGQIKENLANLDGKVEAILNTMRGSSEGKD